MQNLSKQTIVVAVAALIIGIFAGALVKGSFHHEEKHTKHAMHGEMDAMMAELEGKTGNSFDQAFLSEMTVHHEGAVAMAEAALAHASHEEIKIMARTIIETQTEEIQQMRQWLAAWYGTSTSPAPGHSSGH
ncbi:MAG TPA: DUF305 domain-containing protein [Candidatus Paceibacterota bacterium]|jgi:uncharacterized protein (DUF305 family)